MLIHQHIYLGKVQVLIPILIGVFFILGVMVILANAKGNL